jgi:hypothetical protein
VTKELSIAIVEEDGDALPELVARAASTLESAKTAAEVLEAHEMAGMVYDMAKRAARFEKAKGTHDEVLAAVRRAQADALLIESRAKARLADEYDAAQERGELRAPNNKKTTSSSEAVSAPDIGLTHKQVHEARVIRDAEKAAPGTVAEIIAAMDEPTRAQLRRELVEASEIGLRRGNRAPSKKRKNPLYKPPTPEQKAWTHLYGDCRALVEWAETNLALARKGLADADYDQSANLAAVKAARDLLTQFLEH